MNKLRMLKAMFDQRGANAIGTAIGAILVVFGILIFYAIYGGVNTDSWDTTVVTVLALFPTIMVIVGAIQMFRSITSD